MRKGFMCSLCHHGIHGGGLYLEQQSVSYVCQKLTIDEKYKKLVLPLDEIKEISWKWMIFPMATFYMANGEEHKLIIFNKKRFEKSYQAMLEK